ncbi:MAG: GNAT family N-acetyltransferase [Candidatus Entotheonellia bacterium]
MKIVETRTAEALTALRDEWNELLERCDRATIFLSWEWNEAWWRYFGHGKHLLLLQVREHGILVGLAPFCISRYPGTPLRRLVFVGTETSDYLDVLAPTDRAFEICTAIVHYLTTSRDADLVDLHDLRPTALLRETVAQSSPSTWVGHELSLAPQEPCPYLPLPSTWEEYLKRLSKNTRHHLPRCQRAFGRDFEHAEIRMASATETAEAMTALFELHRRRWESRQQSGQLASEDIQAFHRRVAEQFLARGWLRLYIAYADGHIVGVEYAFCFHQRYSFYLNGFDPELARYSLGSLLMIDAIRQAIAEGCREVDFLRGKETYKAQLGATEDRVNARLLLRRRHSARARAMLWLDDLPSRLAPLIRMKKQVAQVFRPTGPAAILSSETAPDNPTQER